MTKIIIPHPQGRMRTGRCGTVCYMAPSRKKTIPFSIFGCV